MSAEAPVDLSIEPWMRGPIEDVDPLLAPVLFSFQQAREDLARYTGGLTDVQLWAEPHGFGSVGFHLRHIARSVERLTTYLQNEQLSAAQLATLQAERAPGASRDDLLSHLDQSL